MKKTSSFLLLLLLFVVIIGCQKEPSVESPDNAGPVQTGNGNRLMRMVVQYSPTDSANTEFFYDGNGRWMGHRTTGDNFALVTKGTEIRVIRNPNGIITQFTVTENDGSGFLENTTYNVHYDGTAKRYTSRVSEFEQNGTMVVDSTVFLINNGKIATQRFLFKEKPSENYLEVGKYELLYDAAGNPITISTFENDLTTGSSKKVDELGFEFDNKSAAMNLGVEALVTDQVFFASPNNITRMTYKDFSVQSAPTQELVNIFYEYNNNNKPRSAEMTVVGGKIPVYFRY